MAALTRRAAVMARISPESTLRFVADYMGMRMAGRFTRLDGTVRFDPDEPERSSVEAVIQADSVEPAMAALAPVLRSPAALDVSTFPEIRFESRRIERLGGGSGPARPGEPFRIEGEVEIKGERQPLALEATLRDESAGGDIHVVATGTGKGLIADEGIEIELDILAEPVVATERPQPQASPEPGPPGKVEPAEGPAAPSDIQPPKGRGTTGPGSRPDRPPETTTILGLSGSLRRGSLNRMLLEAAIGIAPPGIVIDRFGLDRVPLYNGDVEAAGDPPAVVRLKKAIRDHDAILIATPEYNHSIPAVTKNAIDWASRPPFDPPLLGKPVALMGASTGRSGASRALDHARVALEAAGARVLAEEVTVPRAVARFDADGRLVDTETLEALRSLLEALRSTVLGQSASRAA